VEFWLILKCQAPYWKLSGGGSVFSTVIAKLYNSFAQRPFQPKPSPQSHLNISFTLALGFQTKVLASNSWNESNTSKFFLLKWIFLWPEIRTFKLLSKINFYQQSSAPRRSCPGAPLATPLCVSTLLSNGPSVATAVCKYSSFKVVPSNNCNVHKCFAFKRAPTTTVTLEKWGKMPTCYRLTFMCC